MVRILVSGDPAVNAMKAGFLNRLKPIAENIQKKYGIAPIITYTQAALESGWGNKIPRNKIQVGNYDLGVVSNNLYGVKAGEKWDAETNPYVWDYTQEYTKHGWRSEMHKFRVYTNWTESVENWAKMISTSPNYKRSYQYAKQGNVDLYAVQIYKDHYATNPDYTKRVLDVAASVRGTKF